MVVTYLICPNTRHGWDIQRKGKSLGQMTSLINAIEMANLLAGHETFQGKVKTQVIVTEGKPVAAMKPGRD